MVTFKAEVYAHQKKKDGTYNIKIRLTHKGRKKYIATPWYATKDDLTRTTLKLKNQKYIDLTDGLIRKYRNVCDRLGEGIEDMTVEQVLDYIIQEKGERFDLDIIEYGRKAVKEMMEKGHRGNAMSYKVAFDNLVKFLGRDTLSIKEVTAQFLKDWAKWITEQPNVSVGYAPNNYLKRLRAIHNMAKREFNDEDAGIIRIPNSPFSHIELPKLPPVRKRAITAGQMRAIAALDYKTVWHYGNNRFNFAKDLFLLSFFLIGMNVADLYSCVDYKDGRITYMRTKTRNRREDNALMSVKVEPEAVPLVEKYRDPTGKRLFRFYKMYKGTDAFSAAINKGLKDIGRIVGIDDLEFYAARHTWATIAINDVGIDKYTVHTALNHVDETMRVTDIYIKKDWSNIDNANRRVLDFMGIEIKSVEEPLYTKGDPESTILLKQKT